MKKASQGFMLVEVLLAVMLSVTLFGTLIGAFMTIRSLNMLVKHRTQAVEVVRGQIENLKVSTFSSIVNSTSTVSYDAGVDGIFGTADDAQGTLTTTVQDFLDMDGDGNTTETSIDVDKDMVNDPNYAKPVRVTFTWSEYVFGKNKTYTVTADTLIAA